MTNPPVDQEGDESAPGPATTVEEAMDRATSEDGHVDESAYAPSPAGTGDDATGRDS